MGLLGLSLKEHVLLREKERRKIHMGQIYCKNHGLFLVNFYPFPAIRTSPGVRSRGKWLIALYTNLKPVISLQLISPWRADSMLTDCLLLRINPTLKASSTRDFLKGPENSLARGFLFSLLFRHGRRGIVDTGVN